MVSLHCVQCTLSISRRISPTLFLFAFSPQQQMVIRTLSLVVLWWWNALPSDSHVSFKEYHKVFEDSPL